MGCIQLLVMPMPVHSDARQLLASNIRLFLTGGITNDDLLYGYGENKAARLYIQSQDPAVQAVYRRLVITFDTYSEVASIESFGLTNDECREVERTALFLESDLEYEWPDRNMRWFGMLLQVSLTVLTCGYYGRLWAGQYGLAGDESVWPFISRKDYEVQLAKHERSLLNF